jgi:hypothetical protein
VRFQVLTAASMKMAVFWVVAPRSMVEDYRRFRGVCCLHHQDPEDSHLHETSRSKSQLILVRIDTVLDSSMEETCPAFCQELHLTNYSFSTIEIVRYHANKFSERRRFL